VRRFSTCCFRARVLGKADCDPNGYCFDWPHILRQHRSAKIGSAMNPGLLVRVFSCLAAALWLVSAVFWAFSASIEIRDLIDAFIGDLQRAGNWNTWAVATAFVAALASCVAAVCDAFRPINQGKDQADRSVTPNGIGN
jgi:hypothetical protein